MPRPDKKKLSERDICAKFIAPALINSGWGAQTQIREEVYFKKERVLVRGKLPIPLPPLAEQRRIVARVDEFMAVLDALEATLTTIENLLAATIARLNELAGTESPVLMAAEDPAPYHT